jgi:hypothetical protein
VVRVIRILIIEGNDKKAKAPESCLSWMTTK